MTFSRTTSENPGFIKLVKLLDAELAIKDGEEHAFYAQYNGIDDDGISEGNQTDFGTRESVGRTYA